MPSASCIAYPALKNSDRAVMTARHFPEQPVFTYVFISGKPSTIDFGQDKFFR